ncbi:MAG: aromatic ring-hydroxylating dioxygenase subunit alpha, partial [Kordiimonadaceae bacterium]|nr:aromatic ring-hydroxylating dioxygenase subunit alpha [Kordiimonadaceae bacterium]
MDHLKAMLKRRKVGHSLEGDFYHSQAILDIELKAIFEKEWVFVGNSSEIPNPGD